MRDSFIFYRSFQDAIIEASEKEQLLIYRSIANYALDRVEPELTGIAKLAWVLIKPQLEANWKRYEAGVKHGKKGAEHGKKGGRPKKENPLNNPLPGLDKTLSKPSNVFNVNENVNVNGVIGETVASLPSPEYQKFLDWIKDNAPYCDKNLKPISEKNLAKLKETYTATQISETISAIENRKDLRKKYSDLYLTTLKWLKRDHGTK